jgi:predicted nucleic-acid-binding protein
VKASTEKCAIDANVILRYLMRDVEQQYGAAAAIMDAVQDARLVVLCDPVTLAEVVWVLQRVYGLSRQQIREGLSPILAASSFQMPDKARYIRALAMHADLVPHFGDACACAAALEACEGKLLSFDKDLSGAHGITRLESIPA